MKAATKSQKKRPATNAEISREQMLKRMGIKDADFRDYLTKHAAFLKSLNASQRKFHHSNIPRKKVGEVAKSLGPDVTSEHVKRLFKEAPPVMGVMSVSCCRNAT